MLTSLRIVGLAISPPIWPLRGSVERNTPAWQENKAWLRRIRLDDKNTWHGSKRIRLAVKLNGTRMELDYKLPMPWSFQSPSHVASTANNSPTTGLKRILKSSMCLASLQYAPASAGRGMSQSESCSRDKHLLIPTAPFSVL